MEPMIFWSVIDGKDCIPGSTGVLRYEIFKGISSLRTPSWKRAVLILMGVWCSKQETDTYPMKERV